jgi:anaerobic magnesium-protoporphyrin IX monomethyl ester cyclase
MNDRRILFLFPNTANSPAIPNAIAIFAGIARQQGWEMEYFDTYVYQKVRDSMEDRGTSGEFKPVTGAGTTLKPFASLTPDLQRTIDRFQPNVIAVSCMSFEYEFLVTFFPSLRVPDHALVIIGGVAAILEPDKVVESGLFDLVCVGEGEAVFGEILKSVGQEGLRHIKNTYFRDRGTGAVTCNSRRRLLTETELWDYVPDSSLFDDRYFLYPFDGTLYRRHRFEIARGCPFNCGYCGNTALKAAANGLGKFVRTRPLASIRAELPRLSRELKTELLYFEDECFLSHPLAWLREFADWYGREIKLPFIVQTRPETVTDEKLRLLRRMKAPFFQVSLGVESGSERILNEVCNRRCKVCEIETAFDLLQQHRIRTCAFFMIGFPSETRDDIFDSIRLCRRIKPTVAIVSIFQPMPGQPLRERCLCEGLITGDEPLQTFTGGSILRMPQISQEDILNLRRVFLLYATLPEHYYPQIEKCERNYSVHREVYDELVKVRWQSGG